MGTRDVVRMSPSEVDAFLGEQLKVQVGTVGADGAPHLTTLFYTLLDGRIAFWTYRRSQKIRNLERDPRIGCLVEDGTDYFALRGVSINGRVEFVTDPEQLLALGSDVARRMVGAATVAELGDLGMAEVRRQATKRIGVIVHPDKVATWDHSKLIAGLAAPETGVMA